MIDTDMFLNIVEKHHHKGGLHSDDLTNFCLIGAVYVASGRFDFDKGEILLEHNLQKNKLFKALEKIVNPNIDLTIEYNSFQPGYMEIADFNDDEKTSHEDIMLVAKKAVEELELENNNI